MWIVFNKATGLYFETFKGKKAVIWNPERKFAKRVQSKPRAIKLAAKLKADVLLFRDTEEQKLDIPRNERCWSFMVRYRIVNKFGKMVTTEISDSVACKTRPETRRYMKACAADLVRQQGAEILEKKSYPIRDPKHSTAGKVLRLKEEAVETATVAAVQLEQKNKARPIPRNKRKKFKAARLVPKKPKNVLKHQKLARKIQLADKKLARKIKAVATLRKGSTVELYSDRKAGHPRQKGKVVSKSGAQYMVQTETALRTVTIDGIRI